MSETVPEISLLLGHGTVTSCACQLLRCLWHTHTHTHTETATYSYTHTRLMALFPGLPRWASTRKVKPIWILLKRETVSGSGNGWAIRKSAPRSRQITTPATHHSVFYRPDALPAAQPTASKHWRLLWCSGIHSALHHNGLITDTCIPGRVCHLSM